MATGCRLHLNQQSEERQPHRKQTSCGRARQEGRRADVFGEHMPPCGCDYVRPPLWYAKMSPRSIDMRKRAAAVVFLIAAVPLETEHTDVAQSFFEQSTCSTWTWFHTMTILPIYLWSRWMEARKGSDKSPDLLVDRTCSSYPLFQIGFPYIWSNFPWIGWLYSNMVSEQRLLFRSGHGKLTIHVSIFCPLMMPINNLKFFEPVIYFNVIATDFYDSLFLPAL